MSETRRALQDVAQILEKAGWGGEQPRSRLTTSNHEHIQPDRTALFNWLGAAAVLVLAAGLLGVLFRSAGDQKTNELRQEIARLDQRQSELDRRLDQNLSAQAINRLQRELDETRAAERALQGDLLVVLKRLEGSEKEVADLKRDIAQQFKNLDKQIERLKPRDIPKDHPPPVKHMDEDKKPALPDAKPSLPTKPERPNATKRPGN